MLPDRSALTRAVDSLTRVSGTDGWQSAELRRELAGVEQNATDAGSPVWAPDGSAIHIEERAGDHRPDAAADEPVTDHGERPR